MFFKKRIKLILHAGVHRTGTSTIQSNLESNCIDVFSQGFLYPKNIQGYIRHNGFLKMYVYEKLDFQSIVSRINEGLDKSTHTVILSDEDFSQSLFNHSSFLEELSKYYSVSVVMYLRRQDLWLESWYNQHIKWPWDKKFSGTDFQSFIKHKKDFYWINYFKLLNNITRHIDEKDVHRFIYGKGHVEDTYAHFINFCGISNVNFDFQPRINESISVAKIDLLRRIDLLSYKPGIRYKILAKLRNLEITEDNENKNFFTKEQRIKITDFYKPSNEQLSEHFFNGSDIFDIDFNAYEEPIFITDDRANNFYLPRILDDISRDS